ncbi:MAG: Crp/Fnr family transcriptional regulator [Lewinellaceae bacterium]|nr:Crp/Fnr family transcriptional regulator [Lewinellaceae bacterium]
MYQALATRDDLEQLLIQLGQLPAQVAQGLLTHWTWEKSLKRLAWLNTPDTVERFMYFVLSGTLRIYCQRPDGEEVCLGFSYAGSWAGSYPSLITGEPADLFVQALSPCKLIGIRWADFVAMGQEHPSIERCRRILAEEAMLGRFKREVELLTLPPDERYRRFLARSGHLMQVIPQRHIASYLGMQPETLSRIKRSLRG